LCANLCCWRLKLVDRSLELWLRAEVRARDAKALCIVVGLNVYSEEIALRWCSCTPIECKRTREVQGRLAEILRV
jgi:hypothetical protein